MNIFKLDNNIQTAAEMHCDKHVSKMILESAQMLCTSFWLHDQTAPYKPVHEKHPCTIWSAASLDNWLWLKDLLICLNEEFMWRYNKNVCHKSYDAIMSLPNPLIKSKGLQEHPQCMPDQYKVQGNAVEAYRNYYIGEKHFAKWTKRGKPLWYKIK